MERLTTHILLIEDDEEDYFLLRKLLTKISTVNYQIRWESSPTSGLEQMLKHEHDISMLDYRLGAWNGIELIKEARQQGYDRPIILLTGAGDGNIDIQALQAGADDYIAKSQLQEELVHRIIRYAIERRKAAIEREKLLREQIEQRELDKRRNEFISMVVHEIKTPLTSLKASAQLLNRRSARTSDESTTRLTARMDMQINKLTQLIDDFRDVTRIEGDRLQFRENYFSFDELVQEMVEELQSITDQQTIQCEGGTGKTIWGDRTRIGQVITNFLTNAIKYAPDADRIIVKTSADHTNVTLCVQDFGPGIPKDEHISIFNPFYRIEGSEQRAASGLGLGLYIAAEMIRRQEGKIWVESEEGQGATFCFTLPIDRAHLVADQAELNESKKTETV
jgi:signal transduction histidine kinase